MEENNVSKYESLSYDELSQISRDDHQEDVRQYDKQQNALCFVMIGGICLICGIIFFVLSFVRRRNKAAGLDPTSLPFIVSLACFGTAAILLVIGLVRFFLAHKIRRALRMEINEVTRLKTRMMTENNK